MKIKKVIETTRLIIRPIEINDANDYYEFAKIHTVGSNAGWKPHVCLEETKDIIYSMIKYKPKYEPPNFSIVLKENNKMIGTIELYNFKSGFIAELGYSISPTFQNMGIATEAAEAIINYGFNELNLKRIVAKTFVNNFSSIRLLEKIGMQYEGTSRQAYMNYDGKIVDEKVYAIIYQDYYKDK